MSTRSSWRAGGGSGRAATLPSPSRATWSTSPAMCGIRSGTLLTGRRGLLEIISPAGFDQFFVELAALLSSGQPSPQGIGALNAAYGLQVDPDRTASIAAEHRLVTALPG